MPSFNRGRLVTKAMAAVVEHGEITGVELAEQLDIDTRLAHVTLRRMSKRTKAGIKRLYVVRFDYDSPGMRKFPRPVYAVGDKPDARKPRPDPRARKREYYQRVKSKTLTNSVFNLGMQWRASKGEANA